MSCCPLPHCAFIVSLLLLPIVVRSSAAETIRIATFNVQELSWEKLRKTDATGYGSHPQLRAAAEVLQRVRPDIVLINEIDYTGPEDADGPPPDDRDAGRVFHQRFLAVGQNGQRPLQYEHRFYRATNTGVPTGVDVNQNRQLKDPNDAFGYGTYSGQYGQVLYSRFPIDHEGARTFRKQLWADVPNNLMPDGTQGKPAFYPAEIQRIFRLSSKSHWDVPVWMGGRTLHLLCSHPTPPVFDGPEDAHGRRNFDEIRLWRDYLTNHSAADWIHDDAGNSGGLSTHEWFIVLGDLNADPVRGDDVYGMRAIDLLLTHPRVRDPQPQSRGAVAAPFDPMFAAVKPLRTSAFGRLDYVLPCRDLNLVGAGVYWPEVTEPGHAAAQTASDHRLVWIDVEL